MKKVRNFFWIIFNLVLQITKHNVFLKKCGKNMSFTVYLEINTQPNPAINNWDS